MKEYMQTGLIALVLVVVVVQLFQINSIKNELFVNSIVGNAITGNAVKTSGGSGAVDMTGWTEQEKMMYEHHGTLPARLQNNGQAGKQQTNRMVGGC